MEKIKKNSSKILFVAVIALVCSWAMFSKAGNLNPSAPPGPTMKTLDEVEARIPIKSLSGSATALYVISQSGSYYLTGNINGVIDKNGIEVTANNVTINLNGYSMIGAGYNAGTTGHAITGGSFIKITNGSIQLWRGNGINVGSYNRINDIIVYHCGGTGISVGGQSIISNCSSSANVSYGFSLGSSSTMYACIAEWNESHGIVGGAISVIEKCSIHGNEGSGIDLGEESTIINCTSSDNDGRGFDSGTDCVFTNCTAYGNGTDGIRAYNSKISNCTFNENVNGITAAGSCLVMNNVCNSNSVGILVSSSGSTIRGNNITNNTTGLNAPAHNYAAENTFYGNATNWTGAFTPGTNDMANVAIP